MLQNIYIKTAIRHLLKHKMYSLLNIVGLTVAFSCVLLVFLFVNYEFSYDTYHSNADNLYRVVKEDLDNEWRGTNMWNATSGLLKPTILDNCPEVVNGARILPIREVEVVKENQYFMERRLTFADPQLFEIFSYDLVKGNPKTALSEPKSLVLTEKMALKYFPEAIDPIGQRLKASDIDFTITGVLKDVPENSHFPVGLLASYQTLFDPSYNLYDSQLEWNNNNYSTYIQTREGTHPKTLESKITRIVDEIRGGGTNERYHLQNIQDIHLHSHVNLEVDTNGNILYVSIFVGIALLLLTIGGFNYMNLTSAQLLFFSREAGVRKVIGASKTHILLQILTEAVIISLFSLALSLLIAQTALPLFSQFTERSLTNEMLWNPQNILGWIIVAVFFAILTSMYPALQVLAQNPVETIKTNKVNSRDTITARNVLVTLQFVISIAMIGGTIILYQQLDFVKKKELGFQRENILNIQLPEMNAEVKQNYGILKEDFESVPAVQAVTYAQTALDKINWGGYPDWNGRPSDLQIPFYHLIVENDYLDFYDIELLYGNSFSQEMKTNGRKSYFLLNESAVEALGWNDPINKSLSMQNWSDSRVLGVVRDFHFQPLHLDIEPLAISLGNPNQHVNVVSVKIRSDNLSHTIDQLESSHQEIFPGYVFRYQFLDDLLDSSYRTDQKLGTIFGILAAISIIVAALGLFGLASFMAKQRIKEVGIRKVNGARVSEILMILNKDFIKWVSVAFIIATPLTWFAMDRWLQSFAFRTELSWWIFLLAGFLALVTALLTVSWQSWKAATRNPVEALSYE